jgi:glucose/arabinose dehydrogenase
MTRSALTVLVLAASLAACSKKSATVSASGGCDPEIKLPPGFCALVFADSAGPARHIVVRKNGDVYVGILDQRRQTGGVLALRDTNKDGHADVEARFGETGVHGLVLTDKDSTLLASTADGVIRFRLSDSLAAKKKVDTLVTGLAQRQPPSHSIAIDTKGNLIINIGAASNGCAISNAQRSPGKDPCPELAVAGGIWSFHTDRTNQEMKDGVRIATGLHNAVALAVNPRDTMIYAVSHGRDGLHEMWAQNYSEQQAATAAAEEMIRIASSRADYGWPYCYYDYPKQQRVIAPEYAFDKAGIDRCDRLIQPLMSYPAHWSPMSMLFYTGTMFPPEYRTGVFVAFHGSSQRSPLAEEGFHVIFQQFKEGLAADYTVFATGFANGATTAQSAAHRPVGLAQGPDGALYLSDDKGGRIWKIVYKR